MPIALIAPTLTVLEDMRVTPAELEWYSEQLSTILVAAAAMAVFWGVFRRATQW